MLLKYNLDIHFDTALNPTAKNQATKICMFGPKAQCPSSSTQELLAAYQREHSRHSDTDLITLHREPDN